MKGLISSTAARLRSPGGSLRQKLLGKLLFSCFLLSVLFSAGYFVFDPTLVRILNLRSTDLVLNIVDIPEAELDVIVVEIDEKSIEYYGQWPWPRYKLARLLGTLKNAGAETIGVNILFAEKDRTSPKGLLDVLEKDFGYPLNRTDIPEKILDYDVYLSDTLRHGPYVLGYEFLFDTGKPSSAACRPRPVSVLYKQDKYSAESFPDLHQADGILCNNEIVVEATSWSGFLNGSLDIDGVMRRLPLLIEYKGTLYPSFALAVLMHYRDTTLIRLKKENARIHQVIFNDIRVPIDDQGYFYLGPARSPGSRHISAKEVIEGTIDPHLFRGKIVLVGLTAYGITQRYRTPLELSTTLLGLHQQSIQALASSLKTIRTPLFKVSETATGILGCFILATAIALLPPVISGGLCIVLIVLFWGAAGLVYQKSGYLFSPFFATSALVVTCGVLMALRYKFLQAAARKETKNALFLLRSRENELQSILGTIPDIVFRLDQEGNITFISQAITRYVTSGGTLLGRSIFEFVKPEDLGKADHKLNERRTGDRATYDLELRLLFPSENIQDDDNTRYFSISTAGIYTGGTTVPDSFVGTQGIVKDITHRKKLEQELLQAQKMEAIGNVAAGIAHDLNNILSGLVGYPDLLLMEIPKESPLRHKILLMQKSGRKAAAIVQDLLTLARRKVPSNNKCSINTIIREYLDSVEFDRLHAEHLNIAVNTELDEGIGTIRGSAVHLSKVIMNIVHNGIEAMPKGGEMTIKTSEIILNEPLNGHEIIPKGKYVCITVSDRGVGIAQDDLKRVFEPFYTKRVGSGEGTGLGMTVVWATVKDHMGYIDISSRPGHGTALQLYFPVFDEITVEIPPRKRLNDS
jgi:PAS domain S-box-containing protein